MTLFWEWKLKQDSGWVVNKDNSKMLGLGKYGYATAESVNFDIRFYSFDIKGKCLNKKD